eukprot:7201916-Pyramimonas_sp.AAC.1
MEGERGRGCTEGEGKPYLAKLIYHKESQESRSAVQSDKKGGSRGRPVGGSRPSDEGERGCALDDGKLTAG